MPRSQAGQRWPGHGPRSCVPSGTCPPDHVSAAGALGVPIKSPSGHRGLTPSSSETSDLLDEVTPAALGDPHIAPPHARGHPNPAPCQRVGEAPAAQGPRSPGGSSSARPDHMTPQLPNRGGSMRHVTQTGPWARVQAPPRPLSSPALTSLRRPAQPGKGLGGGHADRPAWWDRVGFQALERGHACYECFWEGRLTVGGQQAGGSTRKPVRRQCPGRDGAGLAAPTSLPGTCPEAGKTGCLQWSL